MVLLVPAMPQKEIGYTLACIPCLRVSCPSRSPRGTDWRALCCVVAPRPLSISYIDDFSNSLRPPWTVAHQAPPSVGFSSQEYWGGSPFPSPGDLPDPGTEPRSPALQADALRSEPPGFPILYIVVSICHSQAPSTSHLPLSPLCIHTLLLCVSISAFQIGSSIPFF